MKLFKKISAVLMILVMSMTVMAACGEDGPGGGGGRVKTVSFYTFGNDRDKELLGRVVDAFEAQNPLIKIDVEFATGGTYYNNVQQRIGASNAPDIYHMEGGIFSFFAKSGLMEDLTPYMQASETFDMDNLWSLNDAFRYDVATNTAGTGSYYAIIKDWGPTFMLVYNKDIVASYNEGKPLSEQIVMPEITLNPDGSINVPTPLKWSEYIDIANKLTVRNVNNTITKAGSTLDYVPYLHIQEWIQMQGASLFTADGSAMDTNDAVKNAFQFYYDLQKGPKASAAAGSSVDLGGEHFANGALATAFYGRWAFASYNWLEKGINVGVCAPPLPDEMFESGDPTPFATTAPVSMCIYSGSTKKAEAFKFLEFYFNEGSKIMSEYGFNIPGNEAVANAEFISSDVVTDADELYYNKLFLKFGELYTTSIKFNPRISNPTVEEYIGAYVGNWLDGKTDLDGMLSSIKSAVDKSIS